MSFPSRREIEFVLLLEIDSMGREGYPQDIYSRVTAHFPQITKADLERKKSDGTSLWENRIAWARYQLAENGEIDKSIRGIWRITERGRERLRKEGLLKKEPEEIAPIPISPEVRLHQQVETQLEEIGRIFGKYAKKEHHEAPYTYDVI
jgi:restriction endonuclease Mrr